MNVDCGSVIVCGGI